MNDSKLSAVILAKNEEEMIANCLKSIDWVDEILVIDDNSTDETSKIAEKYQAKVIQHSLKDFCSQRNFALSQIKTEWVLFIDADEEVSPEMASEIKEAIKNIQYDGYRFRRKNYIFGKWIEHTGWYPDWQLHLFRTKKGKYVRRVDEQVELEGPVGDLKNNLIHQNYRSLFHYLDKRFLYTSLEAENLVANGYSFHWSDLLKKPLSEFLRRFFAEEGFKDGVHGLALSLLQAFSVLIVYLKIWEKEGFKPEATPEVFQELKQAGGEVNYWLMKQEKNPLKKVFHKIIS